MSKTHIHAVQVHFGDCDPAGIVFFPNFARWMDQSSLGFFLACGVPPWRELSVTHGIIGTPVLETSTRYLMPATYGETIAVHTSVAEWKDKVFVHLHQIWRGDDLLCEGREVRAFVTRNSATGRLHSVPIPEDFKALCM
ncbi:MAG: acyl-CoA thioesterase [Vitreoscilla sp.]|nr:acyl-CoA thioesterase [Burkholderiales bacterium]MBP6336214.1 acyl-CoA thioesterase [Vitreoscilla sp.]MBP6673964.1 acyl-CoA thioesterase [Vitreoscilla sp.]